MRECPECGRLFPDAETVCPHDNRELVLPGESDPYIGQVIGSYTVTQRLGRGGMGSVYLGQHPRIHSQVAIKILSRRFASDPAILERFFNEARAVNLIGHDNIVQVFDFNQLPDKTPYFVMEWLNGHPLAEETSAPMPFARIAAIAGQITEALQAAHDHGIVHRDLKPDNVFLVSSSQGVRVKILDFGIAKLSSPTPSSTTVTDSGVVMGTAGYLSPEQAAGETAKVSPASDIYSLGVILYQLASGRLPFVESSYAEMLFAHIHREPPPLPGSVPKAFVALILRCLKKRPEERFNSMREVREAINAALEPSVAVAPRARWRWLGWVGAGAALSVGLGMGLFLHPRLSTVPAPPRAASQPSVAEVAPATPAQGSIVQAEVKATPPAPTLEKKGDLATTPPRSHRKSKKDAAGTVIPASAGDGMIEVKF